MPASRCSARGAVAIGLLCICSVAAAQSEPSPPSTDASGTLPAGPEVVREAKPDVFYLKDKDGNLHPVLGFTLEDFERLLAVGSATNSGQPRLGYRLEEISAEGRVVGEHAELSLTVTAFVDSTHWVRVPLRMSEALLRSQVRYEGPGEHFLEFDDEENQYVAWLRGKADQPHRLSLDALVPIEQVSGRARLRLSTPRAWTSRLVLDVPVPNASAQVSAGAILEGSEPQDDHSQLRVMGLGSDFFVSWWETPQYAEAQPTVLDATSAILARIDGRSVHTEVDLTVQSLGGPFDKFEVRLPPQATLVSSEQSDYTIRPIAAAEGKSDPATGQLVEVALNSPTIGPITVHLVTERPHDATNPDRWLQLGGFEVSGAVRQWGHVAVAVVGDWQVLWGQSSQVRQVQDLPELLWANDVVAGFEFFSQPFQLQTRIIPAETRINVEPQYVVMVGSNRVGLDARFSYRVTGAKAFALEIELPGWEIDEVGPASLVKADALVTSETQPLVIPLTQPATGQFDLYLKAHQTLPEDPKSLQFNLPRPRASVLGGAPVVIQPADNVELAPRESDLVGLLRERGQPPVALPPRQQPPWYYRSDAAVARFAAEMRVHQRSISVEADTTVTLRNGGGEVAQQFIYHVARESMDTVFLDVPADLAASGKLEVTRDGKPLAWVEVEDSFDQLDAASSVAQVRVPLGEAQIGSFTLVAKFPLEELRAVPQATVPVRVPLAMPADGQLTANEVRVVVESGLKVQSLDGLWTPVKSSGPSESGDTAQLRLSASVPRRQVSLGVRLDERAHDEETVVDRAWMQTWFTDDARQDRVVYQLTTRRAALKLTLPTGVTRPDITLDGKPAAAAEGAGSNEWIVPLATDGQAHSYVLQVVYRFPDRKALDGGRMAMPRLEQDTWIRRMYWQLVLPGHEHLLAGPSGLTPEYRWAPRGVYWGRQALMDQPQLEAWCGAPVATPLPAGTNQYLFSTLGTAPQLSVRTVDRSMLVLLTSALVLAVGLGLVYLPVMRHPAALLVVAVAVLAAAVIYPDAALVLAQAAGLGMALGILAAVLERTFSKRHGRLVVQRAPSSLMERGSTTASPHPELAGSLSSTAGTTVSHQYPNPESS